MYAQTHYGLHRACLNPVCKKPFTQASHRGYLNKSPTEVIAVMQCKHCRQAYPLIQLVMIAHEYYKKLPVDTKPEPDLSPITTAEIRKARIMLDSDTALRTLTDSIN